MPKFTSSPDPNERKHLLAILRTPTKGNLQGVITCSKVQGTNTHWYGGRTIPCAVQECEACDKGVSWRWHGYVSAFELKNNRHFLFEFTSTAHDAFALYLLKNKDLRGCFFKASRNAARANGRVTIMTKKWEESMNTLPKEPEVIRILCHIWNLNPDDEIEALYQYNHNGERLRRTSQIKTVK